MIKMIRGACILITFIFPACILLFCSCYKVSAPAADAALGLLPDWNRKPIIAPALLRLQEAYPGYFRISYPDHLIWKDGAVIPFNINVGNNEFSERMHYPDLEAQTAVLYIRGKDYPVPIPKNYDPGRIRYEPFFKKLYGESSEEVRKNLAPVKWLPRTVKRILWATSVNGVNEKLQAVSDELDLLPDNIKRYAVRSAGTFSWRNILDSDRLSPHSFGIAIDLDAGLSHYWKWDYPDIAEHQDFDIAYKNSIPLEIVEIFEKYGFIWGGKWYHYDTMHFEYRPELLITLPEADSPD